MWSNYITFNHGLTKSMAYYFIYLFSTLSDLKYNIEYFSDQINFSKSCLPILVLSIGINFFKLI